MFKLHANKTRLELLEVEQITSGSSGTIEVKFCFSDEWYGTTKTVVFKTGKGSNEVIVKRPLNSATNSLLIPMQVLMKYGIDLYCGVYGKKGDTFVIPTVWSNLGEIKEGVDVSDPPPATDAGVSSFNYRTGDVLPQYGDYTAQMVGAVSQKDGTITDSLKFVVQNVEITPTPDNDNDETTNTNRSHRQSVYTEVGGIEISADGVTLTGLKTAREDSEAVPFKQLKDELKNASMGYGIGHGLKVVDGDLTVDAVDNFTGDNTLPMTAAGVYSTVGNIEALLGTI